MLRLFMDTDFGCEPYLWVLEGDDRDDPVADSTVLTPWTDAPITARLQADLEAWGETWQRECYANDDKWSSEAAYQAWAERGRLLWARAMRELVPHGFVIENWFTGYPKTERAGWRDLRPGPIPTEIANQLVEEADQVLANQGEPVITSRP
jgi:hypothetical protein